MLPYPMGVTSIAKPSIMNTNPNKTVARISRASASKMVESPNLKTLNGIGPSDS
jgi:hypothetical protein